MKNMLRKCNNIAVASLLVIGTIVFSAASARAQSGIASVYSGGRTANGEVAHAGGMTAAHRSLPFGTRVRVTNHKTGRSVVVRINDRGPFIRGRVIDLTPAAARAIGFNGLAHVSLSVIGKGKASSAKYAKGKRRAAAHSKGRRYVSAKHSRGKRYSAYNKSRKRMRLVQR